MKPILTLKNITKNFGSRTVVDSLNLDIMDGEIFGLVGVNGSGKTTILRLIIGFYAADNGEILFNSQPFSRVQDIRRKFGVATQDKCFYPNLTVKENVEHFGKLYGMGDSELQESIKDTLKLVELYDVRDMLARKLSGGMQKRVDIACAIVHSPQIIVLDEPTSDLDVFLRKDMISLIKLINTAGITVVVSSHLLNELEGLCHRIGILDKGKLLKVAAPAQLRKEYARLAEVHITTSPGYYKRMIPLLKERSLNVDSLTVLDEKMIIHTNAVEPILNALPRILSESKESLVSVDVKRPSLEDVFEAVVKGP